jgi:ubiquinone/menaquinone biosynthesis C-methylase UbiE
VKEAALAHYRCPADGSSLTFIDCVQDASGEVNDGALVSKFGCRYPIKNGVPNLVHPPVLTGIEAETQAEYDRVATEIYDRAVDWQFAAFLEDENKVRETMVDLICLMPSMRVLEIGCGTGRDSFRLARRLGPEGELHMQDLSPRMVEVCMQRMRNYQHELGFTCTLEYSVSNATALPYPDNHFDAVFHFGGFNHFGDLKHAAAELTRVVKRGGRVLYGDEAVAPWLKGTEFDAIVSTNNALFKADIPLTSLPECARDVVVRWLIANCFYVIAFTKGEGSPPLDLDLPHAGIRGGTLRTRYYGILEGVTPEAKSLVNAAAAKADLSMHEWLDRLIREGAAREHEK